MEDPWYRPVLYPCCPGRRCCAWTTAIGFSNFPKNPSFLFPRKLSNQHFFFEAFPRKNPISWKKVSNLEKKPIDWTPAFSTAELFWCKPKAPWRNSRFQWRCRRRQFDNQLSRALTGKDNHKQTTWAYKIWYSQFGNLQSCNMIHHSTFWLSTYESKRTVNLTQWSNLPSSRRSNMSLEFVIFARNGWRVSTFISVYSKGESWPRRHSKVRIWRLIVWIWTPETMSELFRSQFRGIPGSCRIMDNCGKIELLVALQLADLLHKTIPFITNPNSSNKPWLRSVTVQSGNESTVEVPPSDNGFDVCGFTKLHFTWRFRASNLDPVVS